MKLRLLLYFMVGLLAVVGLAHIKSCITEPVVDSSQPSAPLRPGERERIIYKQPVGEVEIITEEGSVKKYVPPSGSVEFSVGDDGTVKTTVKDKGLSFALGGGVLVSDRVYGAINTEFAYWGRLGLHGGFGCHDSRNIIAYAGIGYNLDKLKMPNSVLTVGYTTKATPFVGFIVRF